MITRLIVRPRGDLRIPMPNTTHLPEEARLLPAKGLSLDLPLDPDLEFWLARRRHQEEVVVKELTADQASAMDAAAKEAAEAATAAEEAKAAEAASEGTGGRGGRRRTAGASPADGGGADSAPAATESTAEGSQG